MNAPNDHDLLVRIDTRTEAIDKKVDNLEVKMDTKADDIRVDRLETRLDKSDTKHEQTDRKLNYIIGGLIVGEAVLKFVLK